MKRLLIAVSAAIVLFTHTGFADDKTASLIPVFSLLMGEDSPVEDNSLIYSYAAVCTVATTVVTVSGPSSKFRTEFQHFSLIADAVAPDGTGGNPILGSGTDVLLAEIGDTGEYEKSVEIEFESVVGSGQRSLGVIVDTVDSVGDPATVFVPDICEIPPEVNNSLPYAWGLVDDKCDPFSEGIIVFAGDAFGDDWWQIRTESEGFAVTVGGDIDGVGAETVYTGIIPPLPMGGYMEIPFPGIVGGGTVGLYTDRSWGGNGDGVWAYLCEAPAPTIDNDLSYEFSATCDLEAERVTVNVEDLIGPLYNVERNLSAHWYLYENAIDNFGTAGDLIWDDSLLLDVGETRQVVSISSSLFAEGDTYVIRQEIEDENGHLISIGHEGCTLE